MLQCHQWWYECCSENCVSVDVAGTPVSVWMLQWRLQQCDFAVVSKDVAVVSVDARVKHF